MTGGQVKRGDESDGLSLERRLGPDWCFGTQRVRDAGCDVLAEARRARRMIETEGDKGWLVLLCKLGGVTRLRWCRRSDAELLRLWLLPTVFSSNAITILSVPNTFGLGVSDRSTAMGSGIDSDSQNPPRGDARVEPIKRKAS